MKNRRIGFGSAIFLALIITLAAGCNPGLGQDGPLVDENGNYIITINTSGGEGRSIQPGDASLYTEEYEIVCRETTSGGYFSGYAKADRPLTVSLPAGEYDMLLLAGDGNRVLLGTGWLSPQTIGPDTGSITIVVDPLTILEAEMEFNDGISAAASPSGTPPIFGPVTDPTYGPVIDQNSLGLITEFTIKKIEHLELAGGKGGITDIYDNNGNDGFAQIRAVLDYVNDDHKTLAPVQAVLASSAATSPDVTLTFGNLTYPPLATSNRNWSALVYLDIQYIPFSQHNTSHSFATWRIRNGLGNTASNGAVLVKSGTGGGYTITVSH
jgi:hypothetical protein